MLSTRWVDLSIFQSTLSVRRATGAPRVGIHLAFISIHALREESDSNSSLMVDFLHISIHALREESDSSLSRPLTMRADFNPRSP